MHNLIKLQVLFAVFCLNYFIPITCMAQDGEKADDEVKITAEQTAERDITMQGTFGGIGASLDVKEGMLVVKDVIAGLLQRGRIYGQERLS